MAKTNTKQTSHVNKVDTISGGDNHNGQIFSVRQSKTETKIVSSPIPPAEELAKYEELCPGMAEVFKNEWVKQAEHRRKLETIAIPAEVKQSGLGQIFGFIIFLIITGLSAYFFFIDKITAGICFSVVVLGLLMPYLYLTIYRGRNKQTE